MGYTPNYFTPCVVDGLGLGSFLAVVAQNPESLAALRRRVVPLFGVAAVALAGGLYLFSGAALPIVQALKGTAYAVTYSLLLLTVLTAKPGGVLHFAFANRAMAAIGKYSYGMYVIHIMVVGLLGTRIRTLWPPLGFTLYATAVFLAAAVIWQVWERPFLNLKSRFTA
jgi:peptidoglycan/LPS O-acetylase OafA/YrhL